MFQDRERLPFGSMHLGLLLSFGWSCWGTSVSWNLDGRCFHSGIHLIIFDPFDKMVLQKPSGHWSEIGI